MKQLNAGLAIALAAVIIFSSCETSQQLVSPTSARNSQKDPKFINDIALTPGGSNDISMDNVISRSKTFSQQVIPILNDIQLKYGSMLGVGPQAVTNLTLYSFIEDWYGTRYKYGGDDKNGIDCSAFVQRLYEHVFCTNVVRTAMEQFQDVSLMKDVTKLREGDLVFFRTRGKRISHVGIYLANKFFVHASSSQGVMISSLDESYWQRTFAGGGQMPKEDVASL